MDKVLYSPLMYAGGKRWLFQTLMSYLSPFDKMVSPFLGGGAIELNLAMRGVHVYAFDKFLPLVNFWQHFTACPKQVMSGIKYYRDSHPQDYFLEMLKGEYYKIPSALERAKMFFLLNRMAFQGMGFRSYTLRKNIKKSLSDSIIDRLANYNVRGLSVYQADFQDTLRDFRDVLAYCDPPYAKPKEGLYGDSKEYHEHFDHEKFAECFREHPRCVVSYNDIPYIRDLYRGFAQVPVKRWSNGHSKQLNELLIFSPELSKDFKYKQLELF